MKAIVKFIVGLTVSAVSADCMARVSVYNLARAQHAGFIDNSELKINAATPNASVDQIKEILARSGYALPPNTSLAIKEVIQNNFGFAVKMYLKYKSIPVDGNIMVATCRRDGALVSLSHNLPGLEVSQIDDAILQEDAYARSKAQLEARYSIFGLPAPASVRDAHLVVVRGYDGVPVLAWRMRVGRLLVDSRAGGTNAGDIVNISSLVENIETPIYLGDFLSLHISSILGGSFQGVQVYNGAGITPNGQLISILQPDLIHNQMLQTRSVVQETLQTYLTRFGQNSFDNRGQPVHIVFDTGLTDNAYWDGQYLAVAAHPGQLDGLTRAPDVIGHELTHGVVQYTSGLVYRGQSGALNESFADIFGEYIQMKTGHIQIPWIMGDTVDLPGSTKHLRDFRHPELGLIPQPGKMADLQRPEFRIYTASDCAVSTARDNCGVHILSGIPNHAFFEIVDAIGWEPAISIYYQVMTLRLHPDSDFAHLRDQVVEECSIQESAENCQKVVAAFAKVGL